MCLTFTSLATTCVSAGSGCHVTTKRINALLWLHDNQQSASTINFRPSTDLQNPVKCALLFTVDQLMSGSSLEGKAF